jgi:isopentenyl diphosphate isomerase/L-lactate dehydrogenase-like FMN-dependent dehydrogenase
MLAPTGFARLAHQYAEIASARAAAKYGTLFVLSSNGSTSIEQVMGGAPGDHWFQLYLWRTRERNAELVERARKAGYSALVLTVDVPVIGKRERDLKNGFTVPLRPRVSTALDVARHPRWISHYVRGGPITFANFTEMGKGRKATELFKYVNSELAHPGASFEDLKWLREIWEGPLLIKGTLTAEEAEESIACGVDGIIVSNHGGRQIDGVQATIDALPEVVEAVRGRAEVYLDGGIRRGTDVVKALCLGARAVFVGRPYLYGAAMGGEGGVSRVLEIFRDEVDLTLALIGKRSVADLDRSCVTRMRPTESPSRYNAEAADSLARAREQQEETLTP